MQQVNLYVPELRPKRQLVTARNVAVLAAALLVFLIGGLAADMSAIAEHEQRVMALEAQNESVNSELEAIKKRPQSSDKSKLDEQLAQVRRAVANRQGLLAIVNSESFGNQQGFSQKFFSLSANIPSDTALDFFAFDEGGQSVRLQGSSREAQRIPTFLGDLTGEASFKNANFGQLHLLRRGPLVEFRLSGSGELSEQSMRFSLEAVK